MCYRYYRWDKKSENYKMYPLITYTSYISEITCISYTPDWLCCDVTPTSRMYENTWCELDSSHQCLDILRHFLDFKQKWLMKIPIICFWSIVNQLRILSEQLFWNCHQDIKSGELFKWNTKKMDNWQNLHQCSDTCLHCTQLTSKWKTKVIFTEIYAISHRIYKDNHT